METNIIENTTRAKKILKAVRYLKDMVPVRNKGPGYYRVIAGLEQGHRGLLDLMEKNKKQVVKDLEGVRTQERDRSHSERSDAYRTGDQRGTGINL
jgi:hypothetical protein